MLALIFLLLGIVFLLVVAGRIWISPASLSSRSVDSTATECPGGPAAPNHMPEDKNPVA
jgi:hypothetical protein